MGHWVVDINIQRLNRHKRPNDPFKYCVFIFAMKPQIVKIGDEYFVEYYAQGLKFQKKGGRDYAHAQKVLEKIVASLPSDIRELYIVPEHTVEDFIVTFIQFAEHEFPFKTFKRYEQSAHHFEAFIKKFYGAQTKLKTITHKVVEEYRLDLGKREGDSLKRRKLINFTLFLIRDMFDYAIKERYLNDNPTLHIKLFDRPYHKTPESLTDDEVLRILKSTDQKVRIILEMMLYAGLLVDEALCLNWPDIDFLENCFRIKTFDGRVRNIPMDVRLKGSLENLKRNNTGRVIDHLNRKQVELGLRDLVKTNCLAREITFSMFRHTFAKNMLARGVRLRDLSVLLGIDDIVKVMRYAGFLEKEERFN